MIKWDYFDSTIMHIELYTLMFKHLPFLLFVSFNGGWIGMDWKMGRPKYYWLDSSIVGKSVL